MQFISNRNLPKSNRATFTYRYASATPIAIIYTYINIYLNV